MPQGASNEEPSLVRELPLDEDPGVELNLVAEAGFAEEQVLRGGRSQPAAPLLRARSRARNEAILRLTRPCSSEFAGFGVVGRKNEQVDHGERRAGGEEGDAILLFSGQYGQR